MIQSICNLTSYGKLKCITTDLITGENGDNAKSMKKRTKGRKKDREGN